MTKQQIFPTILIVLQFCASFPYLASRNWKMAVYWFAAAVLNAAVTF